MSIFFRAMRKLLLVTFGLPRIERFLAKFSDYLSIDLVKVAYNNIGILNYEDEICSGEQFLGLVLLPRVIRNPAPVFFDVGANIGDVSRRLLSTFPGARIVAFEPNPETFAQLQKNLTGTNVECVNTGLGSSVGKNTLYTYADNPKSGHASVYGDMFGVYETYGISAAKELISFEFPITTIDEVSKSLAVDHLDFLKVDVEGYELDVLKGAANLIAAGKVDLIQFEFTDCNVFARVFMRDFYSELSNYSFFRLSSNSLVPLSSYVPRHEIFQYQNILAVRNDLVSKIQEALQD